METGISYTRASSRPFSSAVVETTVCEQYRPHLCRHVLSPDLEIMADNDRKRLDTSNQADFAILSGRRPRHYEDDDNDGGSTTLADFRNTTCHHFGKAPQIRQSALLRPGQTKSRRSSRSSMKSPLDLLNADCRADLKVGPYTDNMALLTART